MCSNFYKFHSMIALLWFILNTPSSAVLFTAISELEYLLQTHKRVIADLESYVSMQEKKLSLLKGIRQILQKEFKIKIKFLRKSWDTCTNISRLFWQAVMKFNMLQTVWLMLLSIFCLKTYTTTINLEHLLEVHEIVKDDLALYISKENEKLSFVNRNLAIFKREHEKAMKNITGYLGNPINAFTLIKRLTKDLNYLRESVKIERGNFKRQDVQYPSQDDLVDAAQNLANLHETSELDIKELAEGKLNGVAFSIPMTAGDCYELGRLLYEDSTAKNAKYALKWFIQAYRIYKDDDMFYPFTKADIVKHISLLSSKMGDIESGLQWTQLLLDEDPQDFQGEKCHIL